MPWFGEVEFTALFKNDSLILIRLASHISPSSLLKTTANISPLLFSNISSTLVEKLHKIIPSPNPVVGWSPVELKTLLSL